MIDKTEKKHLVDIFGVHSWTDSEDFVNQLCFKSGKLLKGGEPDVNNVNKNILLMWQQGKIPHYEKAPKTDADAPLKTVDQIVDMAPID